MDRKLVYTREDGKNIYACKDERGVWIDEEGYPLGTDHDSTSTTQEYEDEETQMETMGNFCPHCGRKDISVEEREGLFREEATAYISTHAKKLIELETIKYLAQQEKKSKLRKLKSCLGTKKSK